MSTNTSTSAGGGIGFCGLLAIAFIVLKLTNFISWSWWWVLSPLWIPAAVGLGIIFIYLIILVVSVLCKCKK